MASSNQQARMAPTQSHVRSHRRVLGLRSHSSRCLRAHVLKLRSGIEHEITTFDSANKYHLIHSLALLAVPMSKNPLLTGSLMTAGIIGFCGVGYFYSFTSDPTPVKLMPVGGVLLMAGWLSLAL
ncbi:transmembrane protein 256 homolog [Diadema antillarum]|uniref:transmembrane protein 256 homolog n=1 Tax=Diadema antillarum TaxID=105358 RepID=UPI003A8A859B